MERRENALVAFPLCCYLAIFISFIAAIFRRATTARNSIIELPEFSQN